MNTAAITRAITPPKSERSTATLILNTASYPVELLARDDDGALIAASDQALVPRRVRLGFRHQGAHPGAVQVLAQATLTSRCVDRAIYRISYVAAFSSAGAACLHEFLSRELRLKTLERERLQAAPHGCFYQFPDREALDRHEELAPEDEFESRRAEPRVPVRVDVVYRVGSRTRKGRVYNVSRHGLYLLADGELVPRRGDQVTVEFPVTLYIKPVRVTLRGRVTWAEQSIGSTGQSGIGLALEPLADDVDDTVWASYVEREHEFRCPSVTTAAPTQTRRS